MDAHSQVYNYLLHSRHPEAYPPAKIPSEYPIPSHITGETIYREVKADVAGNFAIYFSPLSGAWAPLRSSGT